MSRLVTRVTPTLDGSAVQVGDGTVRARALRIEAGAFGTPLWLVPDGDNARAVRVNALPWQGVIRAGTVRRLSSAPGGLALGSLDNNLPGTGWALVTDKNFTSVDGNDPVTGAYWGISIDRQGETPYVLQDATAPSAPGDDWVFRQNYAGVQDSFEPKFPNTGLGGDNEVFIGLYVKFLETWENPLQSGLKWHITNADQGLDGSMTAGWFGIGRESEVNTAEPNLHWVFNGTCADCASQPRPRVDCNPPAAGNLTRGAWHKVQYWLRKDPGQVSLWVDDVQVIDHSGFAWTYPGADGTWQSFSMGATWGGGIGHEGPAGNILYYDRCMIYSR